MSASQTELLRERRKLLVQLIVSYKPLIYLFTNQSPHYYSCSDVGLTSIYYYRRNQMLV